MNRNRAGCLDCGDIVESKHVHDFVSCKCGNIAVDGGSHYHKRSFKSMDSQPVEIPDAASKLTFLQDYAKETKCR